jgi:hypothetical protein
MEEPHEGRESRAFESSRSLDSPRGSSAVAMEATRNEMQRARNAQQILRFLIELFMCILGLYDQNWVWANHFRIKRHLKPKSFKSLSKMIYRTAGL